MNRETDNVYLILCNRFFVSPAYLRKREAFHAGKCHGFHRWTKRMVGIIFDCWCERN